MFCFHSFQGARGGLRDKPGKSPDYYHTCYCLSGLAQAQHASGLAQAYFAIPVVFAFVAVGSDAWLPELRLLFQQLPSAGAAAHKRVIEQSR